MTEAKDTETVFRKTRWNKVCWDNVLIGVERADSYYMRSGLIRKDLILRFASDLIPPSKVITSLNDLEKALKEHNLKCTNSETYWVLKRASSSNGLTDIIEPRSMISLLQEELNDTEKRRHILQTYLTPLMHPAWGDRKYHFRALVLAVGDLKVYLFDDIRVLSATDPIDMDFDHLADSLRHITNQSVNEVGSRYCQKLQNRSLNEFAAELNKWHGDGAKWPETMSAAPHAFESYIRNEIRNKSAMLFDRIRNERRYFLALSNCFELFGLDFMIDQRGQLWLLEANPDPSMAMYRDSNICKNPAAFVDANVKAEFESQDQRIHLKLCTHDDKIDASIPFKLIFSSKDEP